MDILNCVDGVFPREIEGGRVCVRCVCVCVCGEDRYEECLSVHTRTHTHYSLLDILDSCLRGHLERTQLLS